MGAPTLLNNCKKHGEGDEGTSNTKEANHENKKKPGREGLVGAPERGSAKRRRNWEGRG